MNNIYQSQCYLFVEDNLTWYEALSSCENKNAYLAELIDTEERDAVWNYAKGNERTTVHITDGKKSQWVMDQILVTGIAHTLFLSWRLPVSCWNSQVFYPRGWQQLFVGVLSLCTGPHFWVKNDQLTVPHSRRVSRVKGPDWILEHFIVHF